MTYYSYPFNDISYEKFWKSFSDLKTIDVMDIKSNTLINGKFTKAKCYYIVGKFSKRWQGIKPNHKEYVFQIGEHDNCHGHYINMDITYFLNDIGLRIPFQASGWWQAPSCVDANRQKTVHLPTVEYSDKDCWDTLWGMIKGLRQYDGKSLASMGMKDWWDVEDMHWVGPESIGHLRGLGEFEDYHQKRFLEFIPDRDGSKGINKVIFSQGNYAALMGCYSMTATHKGNYFGFEPEGGEVKPFVMDFWTCRHDPLGIHRSRLVDNWCQIDMLDLWRGINKEFKEYIDEQFGI
jgi:predicted ester cyclase